MIPLCIRGGLCPVRLLRRSRIAREEPEWVPRGEIPLAVRRLGGRRLKRARFLEHLEERTLLSGGGVFDLFTDTSLSVGGLTGSYVNESLRDYAPQDDWRET